MIRSLGVLLVLWCLLLFGCGEGCENNPAGEDTNQNESAQVGYTPAWAFRPWISKDISDGPDTEAFVNGMREHNIPVGVLVLDSPWETNYNTFIPNEERYPNFEEMVKGYREQGIRTVLWMTQMINSSSFDLEATGDTYEGAATNFQEAFDKNYFVNNGRTYFWWKGEGAGLDFFNPDASQWWRAQQNDLLDMGIAGWKLDFGEEYIRDLELKNEDGTYEVITHDGNKTLQAYSEAYYQDFWEHGLERVGREEFIIFARPWDESYGFPGRTFAKKEHLITGWVGDQETTWEGLHDGLDHLFRSAQLGYVAIGGDAGGYLDNNLGEVIPFDVELFNRWVAAFGLIPIFQLHGRQNTVPWNVPEQTEVTIENYRYWATLHDQLNPYYFSLAQHAYANDDVMMHPIGAERDWPNDFRFFVGDDFFIAPIVTPGGVRDIDVPKGTYRDWFHPQAPAIMGPTTLTDYTTDHMGQLPVFLKTGAILPMRVTNNVLGLLPADHHVDGQRLLIVYPDTQVSQFQVEESGDIFQVETQHLGNTLDIQLSQVSESTDILVYHDAGVMDVKVNGVSFNGLEAFNNSVASEGFIKLDDLRLWLRIPAQNTATSIEITLHD